LRDIAVRFGAGEKGAVALFDEDMKDRIVENRVSGMPVRLPTAVGQIEFDRAPERIAAVDTNGGIGKIWSGFAVPGAELDDLDFVAANGNEASPEIAGEPTRLQFEFARRAQRGEERALVDPGGITKVGVAGGELHLGSHDKGGE
jgi:hypothetical protein